MSKGPYVMSSPSNPIHLSSERHPGVAALIEALSLNHDGFRQMAMRRLLNLGPEAVPALIALLGDRRAYVQESAAIILNTMGKSVISALIHAMKTSKDRKRCWGAAWVLATLGPEARAALPKVQIPARPNTAPEQAAIASNHGLWSDSWMTRVRGKLEDARHEVSYFLAACEPA
jgi:HEAT repeat protein